MKLIRCFKSEPLRPPALHLTHLNLNENIQYSDVFNTVRSTITIIMDDARAPTAAAAAVAIAPLFSLTPQAPPLDSMVPATAAAASGSNPSAAAAAAGNDAHGKLPLRHSHASHELPFVKPSSYLRPKPSTSRTMSDKTSSPLDKEQLQGLVRIYPERHTPSILPSLVPFPLFAAVLRSQWPAPSHPSWIVAMRRGAMRRGAMRGFGPACSSDSPSQYPETSSLSTLQHA
jgi:hypothetical protein